MKKDERDMGEGTKKDNWNRRAFGGLCQNVEE